MVWSDLTFEGDGEMSCAWLSLNGFLAATFAGSSRDLSPGTTQTPKQCRTSDVTHIYCYLVSCRMALTLQAHWDRGSDFCLLCLLAAWHHEHLWTGLLNHEQILTNISGQLRNQVLGQSGKWNICAVVNSPHSVPPTALETVGFTICLQKHNWISLLLHYQYSISWSWLYMS